MDMRIPQAARIALLATLALSAGTSQAAITTDLSYVNMQSPAYIRFKGWVDRRSPATWLRVLRQRRRGDYRLTTSPVLHPGARHDRGAGQRC